MEMKLQTGDILAFKTRKDDWLSMCISILTNSDVCHAAMVYSEDSLIELIAPGVCINKMRLIDTKDVYVLRLKNMASAEPLIKTADKYSHSKLQFDFPALIILAGLLIYRKIHPNKKLLSQCTKIILLACKILDELIQKIIRGNQNGAMVCSQFIYQIFYESGEDYKIKIKGGILWSDEDNSCTDNTICIGNLISNSLEEDFMVPQYKVIEPEEVLLKNLYHALNKKESDNQNTLDSADYIEVAQSAKYFETLVNTLLGKTNSMIPLQAMFISAGDILNHSTNLDKLGVCGLDVVRKYK